MLNVGEPVRCGESPTENLYLLTSDIEAAIGENSDQMAAPEKLSI